MDSLCSHSDVSWLHVTKIRLLPLAHEVKMKRPITEGAGCLSWSIQRQSDLLPDIQQFLCKVVHHDGVVEWGRSQSQQLLSARHCWVIYRLHVDVMLLQQNITHLRIFRCISNLKNTHCEHLYLCRVRILYSSMHIQLHLLYIITSVPFSVKDKIIYFQECWLKNWLTTIIGKNTMASLVTVFQQFSIYSTFFCVQH